MCKKGGFFYLIKIIVILALVGAGFFCAKKIAASQSILINEIQIYPTESRFIELYNPNDFPVDLTDWYLQRKTQTGSSFTSLVSKTYFNGKSIGAYGYFLIYRSALSNSDIVLNTLTLSEANTLQLKNSDGDIVDKVGWGAVSDCEGSCALSPTENQSLQRKFQNNIFVDAGNNAEDFEIKSCPSPKAQEAICQDENSNNSGDGNNNATSTPIISTDENTATSTSQSESASDSSSADMQSNNFGDLVINELVSDPADNDVEWIEIYNKTSHNIDLSGWWIEDGSKTKTILSEELGVSGSDRYKVIEKPNGNLNNSGDIIILYDSTGKIIDQVVYGNWNDGNIEDNAPAAADPGSTARKFDGNNTYNNFYDFDFTLKPTKGSSNIIQKEDETSAQAKIGLDFSNDILISEILPNPIGDDTKLEFIEIYNAGQREINLTGWSLSNENNKKVNLEKIATSTIIKAGEYLAFYRPQTKIVLYNDQGQIKLFQPLAEKPFMEVNYKNVKEGQSYNLINIKIINEWVWSETITPGAANIAKAINHAPEAEFSLPQAVLTGQPIIFDSSDSADQDNDKLTFSWDFGDGFKNNLANPEHTYLKAGIYKIKLEVSDGQTAVQKEKSITVVNTVGELQKINEFNLDLEAIEVYSGLIINEFMPNPSGADINNEWIEFKNQSLEKIDLLNWRIENSNGKYRFSESKIIEPGAFYILKNSQSKLALKNSDDFINLYNNKNELVDSVEYLDAIEKASYARGANNKWFWTTKLTLEQENIISLSDNALVQVLGSKISASGYIEIDLEKVKELEIGSQVKIKGVVAVEPGILGAQFFYIISLPINIEDMVNKPGLQIYNYKKDFPVLRIGDYIEVAGELAQTQGELRIKTKNKDDIKILEANQQALSLALKADEIGEGNIGQLLTISGEITDKKSTSLYIDDGSDEIFVYIKSNTGISLKDFSVGQKVMVTGILSKTQTGLRLLPRCQEDIVLNNSNNELNPRVLGEVTSSEEWDLAKRDKKLELFKYLLIISSGVIILLTFLFVRAKRKS